ncbi:hypothetical protein A9798_06345 [Edwardsiella hoshinae]|uniref:Uncharacterized protein n=1 Tax=Edwardsiella hoshinae TaxID=93378 RepID=A0ABM6EI74_9GAMM|nr:hypothetical protein A9798_06345 [Edwardsiella hoshinae]
MRFMPHECTITQHSRLEAKSTKGQNAQHRTIQTAKINLVLIDALCVNSTTVCRTDLNKAVLVK